jgi:PKD repeat protein
MDDVCCQPSSHTQRRNCEIPFANPCPAFLTSCSLVSSLVDEGDPPIISELNVNPEGGPAPLLSSVSWKIITTSREPVTCTLEFGNGAKQTLENCSQVNTMFYTYEQEGGYILVLTASVGKHDVKRSVPVTVQKPSPTTPDGDTATITELPVSPNTAAAPLLASVRWQIAGLKDPVTCELDFGDGAQKTVENCAQVNTTFHTYEKAGGYGLILTAKESERKVSRVYPSRC